jgi:3-hydroxymyristoyl/3-hydroxydecanoyl-(acyl carrier protein) dehydratase
MTVEDTRPLLTHFRVSPTHAALPGHFPGRPVVPGVVILDEVILAAERLSGGPLSVSSVPTAKFLSPLWPGHDATIELTQRGPAWSFAVSSAGKVIARGSFVAEPASRP